MFNEIYEKRLRYLKTCTITENIYTDSEGLSYKANCFLGDGIGGLKNPLIHTQNIETHKLSSIRTHNRLKHIKITQRNKRNATSN